MDKRPNPDVLLNKIEQEEIKDKKGQLTIFFGSCAGVGKTYAMLNAAKAEKDNGIDVIIGIIETHGRKDTQALVEGLEVLPPLFVKYKGSLLKAFDLDEALKRHPGLILIDELAHTNEPNSRHKKRWQDIEELIAAGINVFTTLNVQHLETLNDVIGEITGIRVWETIPDRIFDEAHEIRLVDLPPDELLERLEDGKVYLPEQAKHAAQNFFRKGNLIALRELALRRTADRVDAQMQDYKNEEAIDDVWNIKDRLMVCLGPHGGREKLVRTAARLAANFKTDWIAVYVETPQLQYLSEDVRQNIFKSLKLAETLGAETKVLSGDHLIDTLIDYALTLNVSKIIIGRSQNSKFKNLWPSKNLLNELIEKSNGLDFYIVGEWIENNSHKNQYFQILKTQKITWPIRKIGFLWGFLACAFITWIAKPLLVIFDFANIMMLYLLGTSLITLKYGRWPGIFTAFISILSFNFFLIPKRSSFFISNIQYLLALIIMIAVVVAISKLTLRLQAQSHIAMLREKRTNALYRITKALSDAVTIENIIFISAEHLYSLFQSKINILLPNKYQKIELPKIHHKDDFWMQHPTLSIAQWVYDNEQPAGLGTETLPGTTGLYLPLKGSMEIRGVLVLEPIKENRFILQPEQRQLLDTFAAQIALAIDRISYVNIAQKNN